MTGFLTPPWQYFYHQSVGMPPQTRPSSCLNLAKMISGKELAICMLWKQAVWWSAIIFRDSHSLCVTLYPALNFTKYIHPVLYHTFLSDSLVINFKLHISCQLSPKKTWEGFIGGGVTTVIYGWLVSNFATC